MKGKSLHEQVNLLKAQLKKKEEHIKELRSSVEYHMQAVRWWMEYCDTQSKRHESILSLPPERLISLCTYGKQNNSPLTVAYKKN